MFQFVRGMFCITVFALTCGAGSASAQQVITVCGSSTGKSYYLEPTKDGWVDDGISGGTIKFLRLATDKYDIVMKSKFNEFSAVGDGATVIRIHGTDDNVSTFIVIYPLHATEVYQLTLNASGRGTLIWSNLKNRFAPMGITRGSVFIAECSK